MIILIADDDKNIRFALKSMLLDVLDADETTFFEAQDGIELVNVCTSTIIDVAFVDIKMPNMNGLDAIEKVRKFNDDISFIILSGFSDFKYAKRGISLGVTDYLLKPVDSDDLEELIVKVNEEKRLNKNYRKSRLQAQVFNISSYLPVLGANFDFTEPPLPKGHTYMVMNFVFFFPKEFTNSRNEFKYTTLANIPQFLSQILPLNSISCHLKSSETNVQCLVQIEESKEASIVKEIEKNILRIDDFPLVKVVALYSKCNTLVDAVKMGEINEKYQYLSLNQKAFRCTEYNKNIGEVGEYLKLLWLIQEAHTNNDGIEYLELLEKFEKQFKEIPKNIKLEYLLNSLSPLVDDKKITNQKEFVKVLRNTKILARENTNDIAEQIKKYVELNYATNFGINQVAEELKLTPNYLSSLFHKITGIYFSDYLNSYRLEKAKKILLSNSSASIKDIAMMVGYSNARYFSSLFKQSFDMLPSSYRKQYLDK
jgi:two-component system response regulator YesN